MKKNKKNQDKTDEIVNAFKQFDKDENTDVLGSWTGVPKDRDDKPVQDADDL